MPTITTIQKWGGSYSVKIKVGAEIARYRIGQPVMLKPAVDDNSFHIMFGKYDFTCLIGAANLVIKVDAVTTDITALGAEAICDILAKTIFII